MSQSILFEGLFAEARGSADGQVLENCLLCGKKSLNGYDLEGSFGDSAKVTQLYEGVPVFLDHDAQGRIGRSVKDMAGIIQNARLENGVPRGDISPMSTEAGKQLKELFAFSQKRGGVRNLGCSHVAEYKFTGPDRKRVESVNRVYSVDVVAYPATTRTFTEGTRKQMADEAVLSEEFKTVRTERDQAKADLTKIQGEKDALSKQVKDLESETVKLKSDLEEAQKKVDDFQAKEALAERAESIQKGLKAAGLNPEDKAVCSEAFLKNLMSQTDEKVRQEMISDRASLVKATPNKKVAPTSDERSEGADKQFDAKKSLESVSFWS